MSYRFDNRDKDTFKKDIKDCSKIERLLINRYVAQLNNKLGKSVFTYVNHGVANDGKFLESNKVNTNADYMLFKNGKNPRKIEIKFSRKTGKLFRLKVSQIESYIKQQAIVIVFNGIEEETTTFTVLTPDDLSNIMILYKTVPCFLWGDKLVKEIPVSDFNWEVLD